MKIKLDLRKRIKNLEIELSATIKKAATLEEKEASLIHELNHAKQQEVAATEHLL